MLTTRTPNLSLERNTLAATISAWHRGESLAAEEQALINEAIFLTHQRQLVVSLDCKLFATDR